MVASQQHNEPEIVPDCTVRYDDWAGCGINVQRRTNGDREFVDLTFITGAGNVETHFLSLGQVDQLRAALDAVTRLDPPWYELCPRGENYFVTTSELPNVHDNAA